MSDAAPRRLATHQEHALWHQVYMATYESELKVMSRSIEEALEHAVESADRAALALSERIGLKDESARLGRWGLL